MTANNTRQVMSVEMQEDVDRRKESGDSVVAVVEMLNYLFENQLGEFIQNKTKMIVKSAQTLLVRMKRFTYWTLIFIIIG